MNLKPERSDMNGRQSIHSGHSSTPSPRKGDFLQPNPQHRPHAARTASFNPHRLSHVPPPHHFQGVNDAMAYSTRDASRLSSRYSIGQQIGPDVFRRTHSDNPLTMLPFRPSSQTFTSRDQKRATLLSQPDLADPRLGNAKRASRVPEMPRRPNAEPTNLIHSIRDSPFGTTKSRSVEASSKRVVTGILQSALPLSARPPPVDTAPTRSMPIAELEKRHKAALQKLQTHTNQLAAKSLTPSQSKPAKPQQKSNLQVKRESASERSVKSSAKLSNPSYRRSLFSFLTSKEDTKSSSTSEEPVQSKQKLTSKKQKEVPKAASDRGEEEDEDVPLAQLRDRRASYHPASQTIPVRHSRNLEPLNNRGLIKSFSVPTNVNTLQDRRESPPLDYTATKDSPGMDPTHHSKYAKSKNHSERRHRASTHLESFGGFASMDKPSSLTSSAKLTPGLNSAPSWLQANFELSNDEKNGPRPLIFEDEAKAIRNSKRLWVQ